MSLTEGEFTQAGAAMTALYNIADKYGIRVAGDKVTLVDVEGKALATIEWSDMYALNRTETRGVA